MRFALVTITFFLENTNVMQTNEIKKDRRRQRQPAPVVNQNTGLFFFVRREYGGRLDVTPTSLGGLSLYLASSGFKAGWQVAGLECGSKPVDILLLYFLGDALISHFPVLWQQLQRLEGDGSMQQDAA